MQRAILVVRSVLSLAWPAGAARGVGAQELQEAALASGREQTARLPEPVPMHLEQWAAWVDPDGALQLRRDLSGRDARVADALDASPPGR